MLNYVIKMDSKCAPKTQNYIVTNNTNDLTILPRTIHRTKKEEEKKIQDQAFETD